MKINCIACGHNFDVDEAYDDYEGPVRCWVCGTLLEIKTEEGSIRRMRVGGNAPAVHQGRVAEDSESKPQRSGVEHIGSRKTPVATASKS